MWHQIFLIARRPADRCILNLEKMVATQTKVSSIMPGYLITCVVASGYKDRRLLRLLILKFVYYFVVWTVLLSEISQYDPCSVFECSYCF